MRGNATDKPRGRETKTPSITVIRQLPQHPAFGPLVLFLGLAASGTLIALTTDPQGATTAEPGDAAVTIGSVFMLTLIAAAVVGIHVPRDFAQSLRKTSAAVGASLTAGTAVNVLINVTNLQEVGFERPATLVVASFLLSFLVATPFSVNPSEMTRGNDNSRVYLPFVAGVAGSSMAALQTLPLQNWVNVVALSLGGLALVTFVAALAESTYVQNRSSLLAEREKSAALRRLLHERDRHVAGIHDALHAGPMQEILSLALEASLKSSTGKTGSGQWSEVAQRLHEIDSQLRSIMNLTGPPTDSLQEAAAKLSAVTRRSIRNEVPKDHWDRLTEHQQCAITECLHEMVVHYGALAKPAEYVVTMSATPSHLRIDITAQTHSAEEVFPFTFACLTRAQQANLSLQQTPEKDGLHVTASATVGKART